MLSRDKILISVIIITYNNDDIIEKNLECLTSSQRAPHEIILINNSPSKIPKKRIKSILLKSNKISNIKIINNDSNIGFAKAANQGVILATGNYILFLNPDFFIDKKAIFYLQKFTKRYKHYILGGKILTNSDGKIQLSATTKISLSDILIEFTSLKKIFLKLGLKIENKFWDRKIIKATKPIEVNMVSGCFMFMNKRIFKNIGGFDEKFFLYLEDLDFCIRARKCKTKIFYIPKAFGIHIGGASSFSTTKRINETAWNEAKRYFTVKHFGIIGKILTIIYNIDDFLVKIKKLIT